MRIPESIGRLREAYRGEDDRLIIHIQDAHANTSAQRNIASIIEEAIRQYGVDTVFIEAGTKDDSLNFLRPLADPETRRRVAERYLRTGDLTAAEYLNLSTDHPMTLLGVEDADLYDRNLRTYAGIVKRREEALAYLDEIAKRTKQLQGRLYPEAAKRLAESSERFTRRSSGFTEYYDALSEAARRTGVNLLGFPHFLSLGELKRLEETIDFEKANTDLAVLAQGETAEKVTAGTLSSTAKLDVLFETLARKGEDESKHPDLAAYRRYLKSFAAMDLESLLSETGRVEKEVFEKLLPGGDARTLCEVSAMIARLKVLLSLQATNADLRDHLAARESEFANPVAAVAFLNSRLLDAGNDGDILVYRSVIDDLLPEIEDFYRTTQDRDEVMVRRALESMRERNEKAAVLITGGYHTLNLTGLLKKQKISYVVTSPVVDRETDQKRYESILLRELAAVSTLGAKPLIEKAGAMPILDSIRGELASQAALGARLAIAEAELIPGQTYHISYMSEPSRTTTDAITAVYRGARIEKGAALPEKLPFENAGRTIDVDVARQHPFRTIKISRVADLRSLPPDIEERQPRAPARALQNLTDFLNAVRTMKRGDVVRLTFEASQSGRSGTVTAQGKVIDHWIDSGQGGFRIESQAGMKYEFSTRNQNYRIERFENLGARLSGEGEQRQRSAWLTRAFAVTFLGGMVFGFISMARTLKEQSRARREAADRSLDPYRSGVSLGSNGQVRDRIATTEEDVQGVLRVQKASAADPSTYLNEDLIRNLVRNGQVLVADIQKDGQWVMAGAVHINMSREGKITKYRRILRPRNHTKSGDVLYDFWIVVDKDLNRWDEISIADALIDATAKIAAQSGKLVMAYSRPGDALNKLPESVRMALKAGHMKDLDYKAKLALRHFLNVRPAKNRKADGSVQPFLDWLKEEGIADIEDDSLFSRDLRQVLNADPSSRRRNPVRSPDFVKLVGLLFRQFLNENPELIPIDPALGLLHSRKGAHLHRIYFDSRPDDELALGMNFIMSYERVPDLPAAIDKLAVKRGYTLGARLAAEHIEEVDPAQEVPVESGIVYAGRVADRRWYRENMAHTFAGAFTEWLKEASKADLQPNVLDASAGTGAATMAVMERLTANGLRIGNAYAVDVSLKPEFNLFSYGAGLLKSYEGGAIERFLPYRLLWNAEARTFGKVSDIPGIREDADLALLMNAVHLVRPKDQTALFRQYYDAMKPGGLLIIGSSGVDHPDRKPEERLLDSLFETVRSEIPDVVERRSGAEVRRRVEEAASLESARKARGAFILPAVMPDVIQKNLEAAGFEKVAVRTDRTRLEADDFEPFLIEVPAYVQMYFSELYIAEDGSDLFTEAERKSILKEAYDRAFQKAGGSFTIWWTTIEAQKPRGARLADAPSGPALKDLVDIQRRTFFSNPSRPEIQLGALSNLYELGKRAKGSDEDTLRAVTDLLTTIGRDRGRDGRITQRAVDYLLALSVKTEEETPTAASTVDAQALIQNIGQIMMRAVNGQTRVRVVYEKSLAPGLPGVRMESVGDFERYILKGSRVVVRIDGEEETLYLHAPSSAGQSKLLSINPIDSSADPKGARLALPEVLRLRRARARVDEMMKEPSIRTRNRLIDVLSGETAEFHKKIGMSSEEEALLAYLSSPEVNEIFGFIDRETRDQRYEHYALYRPEDHSWILQLRTRGWFSRRVVSWVSFRFNPSWTNPKILDAWTDPSLRGQHLYGDAVREVISDRFDRVWHVVKEANTLMDIYEQMPDGVKDAAFAEKFKELLTGRAKAREAGIPYELEQVSKSALHYHVWKSLRALRVGGGALSSDQISRTILGSVLGKMGFDISLVATNRGSIWLLARRGGRVLDADEEITTSEARRWIEAFQERYPDAPLSGWVRDFINLFEDRLGELPPDDLILELAKALRDRTIGIWEADAFVAGLAPDSRGRTDFAEKFRQYMKEHDHIAAIQTGIEPDPLIKRTLSGVAAFWASEIVRHHSLSEEEVLSWLRELEEERRSLSQRLSAAEEAEGSKYKGPSAETIRVQGSLKDVLWKRIQTAAERYPAAAEDPYFVLRLAALGTSESASALHNVAHHWIKEDRLGRYDLSDPSQKKEFMDHLFKEVLKNRFVLTDFAASGLWQRLFSQKEDRLGRISRVPVRYTLTSREKALLLELSGFWVSRSAGARLAISAKMVRDVRSDLRRAVIRREMGLLQRLIMGANESALEYFAFIGALAYLNQTDREFHGRMSALAKTKKFKSLDPDRLDPTRLFAASNTPYSDLKTRYIFHDDVQGDGAKERAQAFFVARKILLADAFGGSFLENTLRHLAGEGASARKTAALIMRDITDHKKPPLRIIRFHKGKDQDMYVVMIPYKDNLISFALNVSRENTSNKIRKRFFRLQKKMGLKGVEGLIVPTYAVASTLDGKYFGYSSQYLDLHPALHFDGEHFYLKAVHLKDVSATFKDDHSTRAWASTVAELLTTIYQAEQEKQIGEFSLSRGDVLVNKNVLNIDADDPSTATVDGIGLEAVKLVAWRETSEEVKPSDFIDYLFGMSYLDREYRKLDRYPAAAEAMAEGVLEGYTKGLRRRLAAIGIEGAEVQSLKVARQWLEVYMEEVRRGTLEPNSLFSRQRIERFIETSIDPRLGDSGARLASDEQRAQEAYGIVAKLFSDDPLQVRAHFAGVRVQNWYDHGHDVTYILDNRGIFASMDVYLQNERKVRMNLSQLSLEVLTRLYAEYDARMKRTVVHRDEVLRRELSALTKNDRVQIRYQVASSKAIIMQEVVFRWFDPQSDQAGFVANGSGPILLVGVGSAASRQLLSVRSLGARLATRNETSRVTEWDDRPVDSGILDAIYVRDDMNVRSVVNPKGASMTALYKGAGVDVSNFLLSTDADEADFEAAYYGMTAEDLLHVRTGVIREAFRRDYLTMKNRSGFTYLKPFMIDKESVLMSLAIELEAMGVDRRLIQIDQDERGYPRISFSWAYAGEAAKPRRISFIDYRAERGRYRSSYDIYYQRAFMDGPLTYYYGDGASYLQEIGERLRPGGFFITDDHAEQEGGALDMSTYFPFAIEETDVPARAESLDEIRKLRGITEESRSSDSYGWRVRIRRKPVDGILQLRTKDALLEALDGDLGAGANVGARLSEKAGTEIKRLAVLSEEARMEYILTWIADHPKFNRTEFTVQELVDDDDLKIYPIDPSKGPEWPTFEGDGKFNTVQSALYSASARGLVTQVDGTYEITPEARKAFSSRSPEEAFSQLHQEVILRTGVRPGAVSEGLTDASFKIDPTLGHYSPPASTKALSGVERAKYVLWRAIQHPELRSGFRSADLSGEMIEGAWRIYQVGPRGELPVTANSMSSTVANIIRWSTDRENAYLYEDRRVLRRTGRWYRFSEKARRYFAPDLPPEEILPSEIAEVPSADLTPIEENVSKPVDQPAPVLVVAEPYPVRSSVYEAFDDRKLLGWESDEEELLRGAHPDENLHRAALRFGVSFPKPKRKKDYSTIEGLNEELRRRSQKGLRIDVAALKSGYMSDPELLAAAKRLGRKLPSSRDYIEGEYLPPLPAKVLTPVSAFLNGRSPIEWLQTAPKEEIWEVFGPASTTAAIILRYREDVSFKTLSQWRDRVMSRSKGRVWTETMSLVYKNIQKKLELPNDGPQKEKKVRPIPDEVKEILHDAWEARIQGSEITLDAYQQASGLDFISASSHLRKLMRNGLLRNTEGYYNFTGKAVTMLANEGVDVKAPVGARLAEEKKVRGSSLMADEGQRQELSTISYEQIADRLAVALNIKRFQSNLVVPMLISAKVMLFSFGVPVANASTLEVTEVDDLVSRTGSVVHRGTIDLQALTERRGAEGARLSDVSEKVAEERMKWNAVTSALPADLLNAAHRVNIEVPMDFISNSGQIALFGAQTENAFFSMNFIHRQAAGRNTQFFVPVPGDLSDAQRATLESLAGPYADFIRLGEAPRRKEAGVTVRLISSAKKTALFTDGTIQLPAEPVAEDDLFGRAPLYLANAFGKVLAADGSFDADLPVSAYRDELVEAFNVLTANRAEKADLRTITTGRAKWEMFVNHRLLPAVRKIIDQIGVLANLKRQVSIAA